MLISLLSQNAAPFADTLSTIANLSAEEAQSTTLSFIDILLKGGMIMIPIAMLFAASIYIFVERFYTIYSASGKEGNFMNDVLSLIEDKKNEEALDLCSKKNLPIARMIEKGIKRIHRPIKEIEESIESIGKSEIFKLEKGLPILAVIAGIAPMFGFLGTIIGVIKIFFDISQTSDVSIGAVSAGLYVKMVASASGLVVGIIAYLFYNWLNIKIGKLGNRMERGAMNFIEHLQESGK